MYYKKTRLSWGKKQDILFFKRDNLSALKNMEMQVSLTFSRKSCVPEQMSLYALKLGSALRNYLKTKSTLKRNMFFLFHFSAKISLAGLSKDKRVWTISFFFPTNENCFSCPFLVIFDIFWFFECPEKGSFQLAWKSEFKVTMLLFLQSILLIPQLINPFWH